MTNLFQLGCFKRAQIPTSVNASPKTHNLCENLVERYTLTASEKHEVKKVNIGAMNVEIRLDQGYD
ncbi:hypothetical protein [Photobacterium kishitanii]|uniref:hypothetical protein n=1 Tax=Photobacterium kishitanii TaxID=318456 RepID=UPI000D154F74|nr:hypothetical protein [Photobacterium kishitanii]PSU19221.1 hypothetical protein CTM84_17330 [Photobacterium kishitanii]